MTHYSNTTLLGFLVSRSLQGGWCAQELNLVEVDQEVAGDSLANIPASVLALPSPRESTRTAEHADTVESGSVLDEEAGWVGIETDVESDGGSGTRFLSSGVEMPLPAESNSICIFPMELEQELRARIAGRGRGEVVVEAVGDAAVAVVSGQGRRQPDTGANVLIPSMCERTKPGDLKTLFVRNLRKGNERGAFKGACAVRAAQIGLLEGRQLAVADVLGDGGFGTVWGVRHAVLPGEFALKKLREVRPTLAHSKEHGER